MHNEMNIEPTTPAEPNGSGPGKSVRKGLTIGLAAGLLGGTAAGFAFGVPGLSSAASPSVVQQTESSVPAADPTTPDPAADPAPTDPSTAPAPVPDAEAGTRLRDALQPLVDDGTITAAQADAVVTQLQASMPARGGDGHRGGPGEFGGPGGRGPGGMGHFFGDASDALTALLGIDADTLRQELSDGSTLAEVATAHGVETQAVIDTLVASGTEAIDQAVTDGKIDAARADEIKADLVERATDWVNGVRPERPAHHDADDDDATDTPTTDTPTTTED